jgi:hypothetical protein
MKPSVRLVEITWLLFSWGISNLHKRLRVRAASATLWLQERPHAEHRRQNHQLFWIANSKKRTATNHPAPASAAVVRLVGPRDDRWSCTCGHEWNTFIQVEFAPHVSSVGLKLNACRVTAGRRIRTGMRSGLD